MASDVSLQLADYVVTVAMLLIPVGIGILFAVKDAKKSTRDEYLLGGRAMSMVPVALSLFVTFASAISLMGTPTDVYHYGAMQPVFQIAFTCAHLIGIFTMIPLIYPLHLTSVYEYLELRFESPLVRLTMVAVGMLQTAFYMAIALLTPALGLQTAAGLPLWVSVIIVGSVGTFYTAIGGMKSVVWTDAFQCLVMFAGIFAMVIKGSMSVGGLDKAWHIAEAGGRTSFTVFDPDPRTRHTWWSIIIGGMFTWFGNIFNQSATQRICSMKTMRAAKISYVINGCILISYGALLFTVGLVMYAYFYFIGCDPFDAGFITNRNQLPPYFVLHTLGDIPGIAGIYMSTLFSGALSTLSSGISALAANTVEDILKAPLSRMTESRATLITKLIASVYGVLIVGLAYAVNQVQGPVTQMSLSVFGACGGPIVGVFLLGASVPWGNKWGALVGGGVAILFNVWLAVGNQLYGRKGPLLPSPTTDMCFGNRSVLTNAGNTTTLLTATENSTTPTPQLSSGDAFFLYDISYEWYGFIGTSVSLTLGVVVSYCTRHSLKSSVNPKLIFPFLRKVWSLPDVPPAETDESNVKTNEALKLTKLLVEDFKRKSNTIDVKF
ncbi:unnamed protein product [Lymnaea stagnalis]|uniref:Sodium-coupled monocarboxylate transporter 1 n=1 Tax=Lymnaea stagnalis TaxID=6523 RepID=A0AAV2GZ80_LYMST